MDVVQPFVAATETIASGAASNIGSSSFPSKFIESIGETGSKRR